MVPVLHTIGMCTNSTWEFSDVGLPVCSLFSLVSSGCAHDMGRSRLALGVTTNHFAATFDGVRRCFGVSCRSFHALWVVVKTGFRASIMIPPGYAA